jgi:hypothetical protein
MIAAAIPPSTCRCGLLSKPYQPISGPLRCGTCFRELPTTTTRNATAAIRARHVPYGDGPVEYCRLLQGQFAYATSPETYLPGDFTTTYDDVIDRALQAAVAAALEAAVERVEALWRDKGWLSIEDSAAKVAAIAAIRVGVDLP